MHGPPAADSSAATPRGEVAAPERPAGQAAAGADLAPLLRIRAIERDVMALRGRLAGAAGDAGREQALKEEIVRLLSKVILFRAGLARG